MYWKQTDTWGLLSAVSARRFVDMIAAAKNKIALLYPINGMGSHVVEFDVRGLSTAIATIEAACKV
jgi:hypothetical protein